MRTFNDTLRDCGSVLSFSFFIFHFSFAHAIGLSVTPYSFCGRVVDGSHAAFDEDKSATVAAYDASSNLLAKTTTFFRADSRRNYALDIPMATSAVDGYATKDDQLTISVTDADGAEWSGVVPLAKSVVGEPGGVKDLDIVLCAPDADTHGVDADLYWSLYVDWFYSDCYDYGEFDPDADHDGDGISTIKEAMAGSDPFDPNSKLEIVDYLRDDVEGDGITFTANPARSYSVECTTNLDAKAWKPLSFTTGDAKTEQSVISCPSTMRSGTLTILLKPVEGASRFYRIRME